MRSITKFLPTSLLAAIALTGTATPVFAELSTYVGYASEYYYRGILQKQSSASAGIDYEKSGFNVGSWAADVGDGLEVDVYGGYTMEFDGGFSLGVGVTGYYYTGEFDDTYEEVNFSAGWGPVSVGYSVGTYDNFDGPEQDYDFLELSVEHNGFYGTYGTFGDDFDGDYVELGYSADVGGFEAGIAAIFNSEELSDQCDSQGTDANGNCINAAKGEALVFTLSKSFDL